MATQYMQFAQCPICGDKHKVPTTQEAYIPGYKFELCFTHRQIAADGMIALVELRGEEQPVNRGGWVNMTDIWHRRTGKVAHVPRLALQRLLGMDDPMKAPLTLVQEGTIEDIMRRYNAEGESL